MKNEDLVKIISITSAYILVGVSLLMWAHLSSLEKGYFYGVFVDESASAPFHVDLHQNFNRYYFTITIGFVIYITSKLFNPSIISNLACIPALIIIIYQAWDMLWGKTIVYNLKIHYWINISIYFDWLFCIVAIILITIQFILIIKSKTVSVTLKIV